MNSSLSSIWTRWSWMGAALLAVALMAPGSGLSSPPEKAPAAPALDLEEWVQGGPLRLDELQGKVVLLDFFQMLCPGCHHAHPHLVELQEKYGAKGLQVIGVASAFEARDRQTPEDIRKYVEEHMTPGFPVAIDRDRIVSFQTYGAQGTPWAVLIDRKGRVRVADFFRPEVFDRLVRLLVEEDA